MIWIDHVGDIRDVSIDDLSMSIIPIESKRVSKQKKIKEKKMIEKGFYKYEHGELFLIPSLEVSSY